MSFSLKDMEKYKSYNGVFAPDKSSAIGHLAIDGQNTSLKLVSLSSALDTLGCSEGYHDLFGELEDGKKASLLGSLETSFGWLNGRRGQKFSPQYIVIGDSYIRSTDSTITEVHYHFENAECLVRGRRTFLAIRPTPNEAEEILRSAHQRHSKITGKHGGNVHDFDPEIGPHPVLLYFSGVSEIAQFKSEIGTITLSHDSKYNSGSTKGIGVTSQVVTRIVFSAPKTLAQMIEALLYVQGFFELCLGCRQRVSWVELHHRELNSDKDSDVIRSRFIWNFLDKRVSGDDKPPYYTDILFDAEQRREEFEKIASGWLNSAAIMGDARSRFDTASHSSPIYTIDRLVGAVNMFDLLPKDRLPKDQTLTAETEFAVRQCSEIIKKLTGDDFARQSVLSALGRIGRASVRDKIIHRANIVSGASGGRFPELATPCTHAVLCRNHYVHGSEVPFNVRAEHRAFIFLIDTVEFVFAISDLIELGWDFEAWINRPYPSYHKFGTYLRYYTENMKYLKELLER